MDATQTIPPHEIPRVLTDEKLSAARLDDDSDPAAEMAKELGHVSPMTLGAWSGIYNRAE